MPRTCCKPRTVTCPEREHGSSASRKVPKDQDALVVIINDLTKKGVLPDLPLLSADAVETFEDLRNALMSPQILASPKQRRNAVVDADTCADQRVCALLQQEEEKNVHPIGYCSRALSPAEEDYGTNEHESSA